MMMPCLWEMHRSELRQLKRWTVIAGELTYCWRHWSSHIMHSTEWRSSSTQIYDWGLWDNRATCSNIMTLWVMCETHSLHTQMRRRWECSKPYLWSLSVDFFSLKKFWSEKCCWHFAMTLQQTHCYKGSEKENNWEGREESCLLTQQ